MSVAALKTELKQTLADVGGLRAEERLLLNDRLTDLLATFTKLVDAHEQSQIDAFTAQLNAFKKDVTHYDQYQQAYHYPHQHRRKRVSR